MQKKVNHKGQYIQLQTETQDQQANISNLIIATKSIWSIWFSSDKSCFCLYWF